MHAEINKESMSSIIHIIYLKEKNFIMSRNLYISSLIISGFLLPTSISNAFKPNETLHGHKKITLGVLDHGYSYGTLGVDKFKTKLSDGREVAFTTEAAEHVFQGNRSTDQAWASFKVKGEKIDLVGELSNPVAHCDDELIDECRQRIVKLKDSVIQKLQQYIQTENPQTLGHARGDLGKALHTIQDFYAHSNYADLNNNSHFYQALTLTQSIQSWGKTADVCQPRIYSLLKPVGGFSSNGGNYVLAANGLNTSRYTTGYFTHRSFAGVSTAADENGVKCDHGVEIAPMWLSGIAKDVPYAPLDNDEDLKKRPAPTPIHARASYQAALHTNEFLKQVIQDIRKTGTLAQQDDMIKALLGIEDEPLYGFIIDDTGSMSAIITGIKNQIQKLIDRIIENSSTDTTSVQEKQFLMVSFNDPNVGEVKIGNAEAIKNAVGALYAHAGGDCPEKANTGILKAVQKAPTKSRLFVFTDASSNDGELASQIINLAKDKEITISYAVSGSCSPIDPSYHAVANATGGQVILVDHNSQSVEAVFTSIDIDHLSNQTQPVLITSGETNKDIRFDLYVEDNTDRLSILVNASAGNIRFISPSGQVISSDKVQIHEFIGGKGLKVTKPEVGKWTIQITTNGISQYDIRADISSPSYIKSIKFLDPIPTGKFEHEGYQVFGHEPVIGENRIEVMFSSPMKEATAILIDRNGVIQKQVPLQKEDSENFAAHTSITTALSHITIQAIDTKGNHYQRVYGAQFTPKEFKLELIDSSELMPNNTGQLRFKVTNLAEKNEFTVNAISDHVKIDSIDHKKIVLEQNIDQIFTVNLNTENTSLGDSHSVLISVKDKQGEVQYFNYVFTLDQDTDGDGISDYIEQGGYGQNLEFDGNNDGIPDWKQANVVSLFSRQKRGYFTYAVPNGVNFQKVTSISLNDLEAKDYPYDLTRFDLVSTTDKDIKVQLFLHYNVIAAGYHAFDQDLNKSQELNTNHTGQYLSFTLTNNLSDSNDKISHIGGLKEVQFSEHKEHAEPKPPSVKKSKSGSWSFTALLALCSLLLLRRKIK
ncbi:hypothetical protein [Acinetobacter sp. NIPH 2699]|uniref:hypothetical protein n=1 Tax=Acinetobacter sp. NIPH 2699 TaxID=2923433 RepID=UPI001F4BA6AA|nr:hypothetical protein [Acinetobacter sp. NIPH 2699]MCH7335515.1 hypothetical protein [Acinetobacter sp. NIPH 2699]